MYYPSGDFKGKMTKMVDGTIVTWRNVSSSKDGSPAVNISVKYSDNHGDLKEQKIHFIKKKG